MKNQQLLWPVLLTIFITIIGAVVLYQFYNSTNSKALKIENELAHLVKNEQTEEKDLKTIIHESQKTVVQIEAEFADSQNIGSGFIFNEKGDILTNAHVVNGAESIFVKTSDAKIYPAALIGINVRKDVAVLRVPQLINRTTLPVDPNFEAEIGDEIIAVGSPLGFQNTVTTGIISGKNRSFSLDGGYEYKDAYQISASITTGNSGGPLIHKQTGKIIAINSAGTKEGTIGFSIPLKDVMDMANMWADRANSDELDYNGDHLSYDNITPEELKENGIYLVNYFYENLNIRDYFTAYTLLGSRYQSQTNYQQFRSQYVHIIDFNVNNVTTSLMENNRLKIVVQTDNYTRNKEQKQVIEHIEASFTVGYENDQLKILDSSQKLLTTTVVEINEEDY